MLTKVRNLFFLEEAEASMSDKICVAAMLVAFLPVLLAAINNILM